MPVITINFSRLKKYIDEDPKEFAKWVSWLGVDIEDITDEYIKIEYNPNRPDYGTLIGVLRTYKGIRGLEKGIIKYYVDQEDTHRYRTLVDDSVKKVRPYIATIVAEGIPMDNELLEELIGFQEDLHIGLGRRRRKISIGLHNLDVIKFPVRYSTVDHSFSFIPLDSDREMSIADILSKHPKGIEYGYILRGFDKYPILIDSEGKVLSFPPIINGVYTIVSEDTKNLYIDVTGTEYELVIKTADIIATALYDYGAKIVSTSVIDPELGVLHTPSLKYDEMEVDVSLIRKLIGIELSIDEIISALESSRLGIEYIDEKRVKVLIPPYRIDIMHPVDVVEEVAIGYGFWRLEPSLNIFFTEGSLSTKSKLIDKVVEILTGLGFQETIHSHLTNPELMYDKMNVSPDKYIEVEHSKTPSYRTLRTWIIPQLMETLEISKKEEYPQKIFEVGYTYTRDNINGYLHLALVIAGSKTTYNDVKAVLDCLFEKFNISSYYIKPIKHDSFIEGRVGYVMYEGDVSGIIGELHPRVLENFKLEVPVAAMEINLTRIFGKMFH